MNTATRTTLMMVVPPSRQTRARSQRIFRPRGVGRIFGLSVAPEACRTWRRPPGLRDPPPAGGPPGAPISSATLTCGAVRGTWARRDDPAAPPKTPTADSMTDPTPPTKAAVNPIVQYFRDFGVLKETGLEYWGIQIINLLDCTFYFAMLTIVTLFLSHDLGMSDVRAGYTVAVFTSAVTLLLTFSGAMTDWMGIKRRCGFRWAGRSCCAP